ncbi:MAG TPA: hypothetical protein VNC84_02865 [Gammaproteobacteria bacterium]|jgi:hypothetical protein|nr:hypothetical protein [Gammaproteobacteria bacterium]
MPKRRKSELNQDEDVFIGTDIVLPDAENIDESMFRIISDETLFFFKGLIRFLSVLPLLLIGGLIVLPIALFFIKKEQKTLPRLLWMFDNADYQVGRDTSTFDEVCEKGKWARYTWLAWRNPLNGLSYWQGFRWTDQVIFTRYDKKTKRVGNTTGRTSGYKRTDILVTDPRTNQTTVYRERWLIFPWPFFCPNKCIEYRNGHKIGNPGENNPGDHIQEVARITCCRFFDGTLCREESVTESDREIPSFQNSL